MDYEHTYVHTYVSAYNLQYVHHTHIYYMADIQYVQTAYLYNLHHPPEGDSLLHTCTQSHQVDCHRADCSYVPFFHIH